MSSARSTLPALAALLAASLAAGGCRQILGIKKGYLRPGASTSTGGTGGTGGATASTGTGEGACPDGEPMVGSPCDTEGRACSYETPCCDPAEYVCSDMVWTVPVPAACHRGCPDEPPEDQSDCSCFTGLTECRYVQEGCVIAACDGAWYVRDCPD